MSDFSSLMSNASTGLTAVGSSISAAGAMTSAQAISTAATYNAGVATTNAAIAEDQGSAQALQIGINAQRHICTMVAQYGASGVQVASGSPLDVLADSTRSAVLDQQMALYNANVRAKGFLDTAALDTALASNATTSGVINAGSQLVNGASKLSAMNGNQIPNY